MLAGSHKLVVSVSLTLVVHTDLDGDAIMAARQFPRLTAACDLRSLHLAPEDRTPWPALVHAVTVRLQRPCDSGRLNMRSVFGLCCDVHSRPLCILLWVLEAFEGLDTNANDVSSEEPFTYNTFVTIGDLQVPSQQKHVAVRHTGTPGV